VDVSGPYNPCFCSWLSDYFTLASLKLGS